MQFTKNTSNRELSPINHAYTLPIINKGINYCLIRQEIMPENKLLTTLSLQCNYTFPIKLRGKNYTFPIKSGHKNYTLYFPEKAASYRSFYLLSINKFRRICLLPVNKNRRFYLVAINKSRIFAADK